MKSINTQFGLVNICVEDFEKFEGFTFKKGMIALDKEMAAEQLGIETLSMVVVSMVDLERALRGCIGSPSRTTIV